jgi:hypothetical protein
MIVRAAAGVAERSSQTMVTAKLGQARPHQAGVPTFIVEVSVSSNEKNGATRREVFKTGILGAVGAVAATAILTMPAQAKMAQKAAMYQPKPHGSQSCKNCGRFIAGKPATADGTCTIVDGAVSPQGWCAMYVPKA